MNHYYISTDKTLLDEARIEQLLKACFWSNNIPIDYIRRFIKYSLCFGVYENTHHSLVGFGRVISDYTTYAYICDVVIECTHRKRGLGTILINTILGHPELQGLKTWSLRTTAEASNIYKILGFSIASSPETQMEMNDLEIYSRPNFINLHL